MEEITVDGVRYTKASKVAKEFRYTTDYIGQLCRSGKVDARLVGRSWYVNPDTIQEHKKSRYKASNPEQQSRGQQPQSPIHEHQTPQIAHIATSKSKHFVNRIGWNPVSYEEDATELIPGVKKELKEQKLPVHLAEAEKVKVKAEKSTESKLTATPLPQVSLNGTLKVESLETYYSPDESSEKPSFATNKEAQNDPKASSEKTAVRHLTVGKGRKSKISDTRNNSENKDNSDVIAAKTFGLKFKHVPADAKLDKQARLGTVRERDNEEEPAINPLKRGLFIFNFSVVLSAIILFFLMSLDSRIESSGEVTASSYVFNFSNLFDQLSF